MYMYITDWGNRPGTLENNPSNVALRRMTDFFATAIYRAVFEKKE
jgi:hypothetical protein